MVPHSAANTRPTDRLLRLWRRRIGSGGAVSVKCGQSPTNRPPLLRVCAQTVRDRGHRCPWAMRFAVGVVGDSTLGIGLN